MKKTIALVLAMMFALCAFVTAFAEPDGETTTTSTTAATTESTTNDDPDDGFNTTTTVATTAAGTTTAGTTAAGTTAAGTTAAGTTAAGTTATTVADVTVTLKPGETAYEGQGNTTTTKKPAAVDTTIPSTGSGVVVPAIALLALAAGTVAVIKTKKED